MEMTSQIAGIVLLLGSMFLLYMRRIDLTRAMSNPDLKEEALKAEIGKLISIKTGSPALGLFALGFVLVLAPLLIPSRNDTAGYKVVGTVRVQGGNGENLASLPDVNIYLSDPPGYHVGRAGNLPDDMEVVRSEHGFPILHFDGPQTIAAPVDLNADTIAAVDEKLHVIRIREPIVLLADTSD